MPLLDTFRRPLGNLRLSVTDRCNLRCAYCMPEQDYAWLPREDILHFEEIPVGRRLRRAGRRPGPADRRRAARAAGPAGARGDAGGHRPDPRTWRMTTNGVLLAEQRAALRARRPRPHHGQPRHAGPRAFRALTRYDALDRVLAGIDAAAAAGFASLKIDTRRDPRRQRRRARRSDRARPGLAAPRSASSNTWTWAEPRAGRASASCRGRRCWRRWRAHYGPIAPIVEASSAPAERFRLPDGTAFGIIASTTAPFCSSCDRSRLTADGLWYLCLYAARGTWTCAGRCAPAPRRGARGAHLDGLARAHRPRRGGAPRAARTLPARAARRR